MPQHASAPRLRRRTAVGVGAAFVSATVLAGPGTATAINIDPGQLLEPGVIAGILPAVPGVLPIALIPTLSPLIDDAAGAWDRVPLLGAAIPITNEASELGIDVANPLALVFGGRSDVTVSQSNTTTISLLELAKITNVTSGTLVTNVNLAQVIALVGGFPPSADPTVDLTVIPSLALTGIGRNTTTVEGPFGSLLSTDFSLTGSRPGTNGTLDGTTTFTPAIAVNAVAPFALAAVDLAASPGSITYGDRFLLSGPALNTTFTVLGLVDGTFQITPASIGFDDGRLTLVGGSIGGSLGIAGVTTSAKLDLGGAAVGGGDGVTVTAPSVSGGIEADGAGTPSAVTAAVSGGEWKAGGGSAGVSGVGYAVKSTGAVDAESSVIGHGEVTTAPSATVGADITQRVGDLGGSVSPSVTFDRDGISTGGGSGAGASATSAEAPTVPGAGTDASSGSSDAPDSGSSTSSTTSTTD